MYLLFLSFWLCRSGTECNYAFLCWLKESIHLWCFHRVKIFLFVLINLSIHFHNQSSSKLIVKKCFFYPFISDIVFFPPQKPSPNFGVYFNHSHKNWSWYCTKMTQRERTTCLHGCLFLCWSSRVKVIYLVPFHFVSVSSLESSADLK